MAMAAGFTTVVACLAYFKSVNSFFPGMIANFLVLLGAHYLLGEEGGWGNNPVPKKLPTAAEPLADKADAGRGLKLYAYLKRILTPATIYLLLIGLLYLHDYLVTIHGSASLKAYEDMAMPGLAHESTA